MSILYDKFAVHNQHWENLEQFLNFDPHLKKIKNLPYVYKSNLLQTIPFLTPGVYLISGGRQVGKSTFLKQSIVKLIQKDKINNNNILFLTGEVIYSAEELRRLISSFLANKQEHSIIYIDEVNYIPDWDRTIKFIADAGFLEKSTLLLSGSDVVIIKDAMKRFPGRRGKAKKTNYHYYSLSFIDYLLLKKAITPDLVEYIKKTSYDQLINKPIDSKLMNNLYNELKLYMITGGYLTAMNDFARKGKIDEQTFITYWEWILGDILKHKKTENYLREIISSILKRYTTPVTWNSLAKELTIDHHKTISDYCDILSQMDAVYIQSALLEHKLKAAPKKAKKVYFTDPFIYHACYIMINLPNNPWEDYISPLLKSEAKLSHLIEASVVTQIRRNTDVFYIKNKSEIDLAIIKNKKVLPVEIKWTSQLRSKELQGISKFPNGIIASKSKNIFKFGNNLVVPIPLLLIRET